MWLLFTNNVAVTVTLCAILYQPARCFRTLLHPVLSQFEGGGSFPTSRTTLSLPPPSPSLVRPVDDHWRGQEGRGGLGRDYNRASLDQPVHQWTECSMCTEITLIVVKFHWRSGLKNICISVANHPLQTKTKACSLLQFMMNAKTSQNITANVGDELNRTNGSFREDCGGRGRGRKIGRPNIKPGHPGDCKKIGFTQCTRHKPNITRSMLFYSGG